MNLADDAKTASCNIDKKGYKLEDCFRHYIS